MEGGGEWPQEGGKAGLFRLTHTDNEIYMEISSEIWRIIGATQFILKRTITYAWSFKISIDSPCMQAIRKTIQSGLA
jgi:hypothetical protein